MTIGRKEATDELLKKYNSINKKGITSVYWGEILTVISELEKLEEYEKCNELWTYYIKITGKP